MDQNPLQNPVNWNKPMTVIVPLEVTIMVDDPSNPSYKSLLETKVLKPLANELRSICQRIGGKQLFVKFNESIDLEEFNKMKKSSQSPNVDKNTLESILDELLKKKGIK
jgi:hypothetical protein